MRVFALTVVLLLGLAYPRAASAYSPIWSIGGWDVEQLAKAGIQVGAWKHALIGEDPPLNWVQVTYDCSALAEDQDVLMTLWVAAPDGQTLCASRAEHRKGDASRLSLLFTVRDEDLGNSRLVILVPKLLGAAAEHDFGAPGFGGYTLPLSRLVELARQTAVPQTPQGTPSPVPKP